MSLGHHGFTPIVIAMKHSLLLSLAAGVMLCGTLHAIPQSVGGFTTAQNNPGNATLEEWFRDSQ